MTSPFNLVASTAVGLLALAVSASADCSVDQEVECDAASVRYHDQYANYPGLVCGVSGTLYESKCFLDCHGDTLVGEYASWFTVKEAGNSDEACTNMCAECAALPVTKRSSCYTDLNRECYAMGTRVAGNSNNRIATDARVLNENWGISPDNDKYGTTPHALKYVVADGPRPTQVAMEVTGKRLAEEYMAEKRLMANIKADQETLSQYSQILKNERNAKNRDTAGVSLDKDAKTTKPLWKVRAENQRKWQRTKQLRIWRENKIRRAKYAAVVARRKAAAVATRKKAASGPRKKAATGARRKSHLPRYKAVAALEARMKNPFSEWDRFRNAYSGRSRRRSSSKR